MLFLFNTLCNDFWVWENGGMENTAPKNQTVKPEIRRVIRRLLTAVDKSLEAAEDVKKARKELDRLAVKEERQ